MRLTPALQPQTKQAEVTPSGTHAEARTISEIGRFGGCTRPDDQGPRSCICRGHLR